MELSPPGLYSLEELVVGAPRRDNWSTATLFASPDTFFSNNGWITSSFDDESMDLQNPDFVSSSTSSLLDLLTLPQEPTTFAFPADHGFANAAQFSAPPPPPPQQQDMEEYGVGLVEARHHDGGGGVFGQISVENNDQFSGFEDAAAAGLRSCGCAEVKMEQGVGNVGLMGGEKKSKSKKVEGQPSKNLMAERRRRKRLNDRLSMLRSIVPKISKVRKIINVVVVTVEDVGNGIDMMIEAKK